MQFSLFLRLCWKQKPQDVGNIFLKILFTYFFRERTGGRKTGRETSICGCLLHVPYWGPGLQPSMFNPRLGIGPATLWFLGQHSTLSHTSQRRMWRVFVISYIQIHFFQVHFLCFLALFSSIAFLSWTLNPCCV